MLGSAKPRPTRTTRRLAPIWPSPHHYLARQLGYQGSPEESLRHQRAAIDLRKRLAEEFPDQLSYRVDLALSLSNLAQSLSCNGQPTEAFDSVRRANAIQRTLVKEHPEDPQLRHTLALSTRGMATILKTLGRWQESRPLFVESVEIMSRIVAENPAVTEFRQGAGDRCLRIRPASHRPRRDRRRVERPRHGTRSSGDGQEDKPE